MRIKELRDRENLSQRQLSEILKVDRTTVNKWESGTSYPTVPMLTAISEYFGVSTDYVLGIDSDEFAPVSVVKIEKAPALPEEVQELVDIFIQLDAEGKAMVKAAAYGELRRVRALPDAGASVG